MRVGLGLAESVKPRKGYQFTTAIVARLTRVPSILDGTSKIMSLELSCAISWDATGRSPGRIF